MEEGTDRNYVEVAKKANEACSSDITFTNSVHIPIKKDVRRDDLCCPSSSLLAKMLSCKFNWEGRVSVNDERLIHFCFSMA